MEKSRLDEAILVLLDTKAKVTELLTPNEYGLVIVTVNSSLDLLINKLSFLSGNQPLDITKNTDSFPPVTNFMGEDIHVPVILPAANLVPEEDKKTAFLNKVNTLQANIDFLSDEKILEDYTTSEDVNAIRGVAKRAGLEDYRSGKVDLDFLARIRAGLADIKQKAEDKAITEDALKD